MKDSDIVGPALAEVLPVTDRYWFQTSHLLRLNMILLVPLLSSAVAGYDGSLMNGLQSLSQWKDYFGNPQGALLGTINAAQSIGSVIALPSVGYCSDKFGRKPVLVGGLLGIVVATVIQASSTTLAQFIVSRLIVGAAGMFVALPSPLLIAELAYPTHRGKYTASFWCMYYLGAILASWTTFGTGTYSDTWSWRIPSIMQAAWPIVQLLFVFWVPESPRWLVSKERTGEAIDILGRYHSGGDAGSPLVIREVREIVEAIQVEQDSSATHWRTLIATPGNRKRLSITVFLGICSQWNGIGVVSYYLTLVLDTIGITASFDQTLINGLLQIFNLAAALAGAFLVDRLGRRTLFTWSGIGMLVSYIIWTACSAISNTTGDKAAGIVVIVCLFTFYFHYDIAYTPLMLAYPVELFQYSLRSKGVTCGMISVYSCLVIGAFLNPIGMENIGWKYYIVFCCFLVTFLAVTYRFFPETKGHSLEEIAEIFDGPGAAADVPLEKRRFGKADEALVDGATHVESVQAQTVFTWERDR
ncbi:general substrate transporter [Saccharata proteae CBS 121410]|uniref:General substrate transporter n=1 Tax=Saccharata proteae CBS 121410 TaxID=1314787 RepID=A0A9P4I1F4_9PEZI|nr:general substrate transporter [Saccharata proteae CBS 121410]